MPHSILLSNLPPSGGSLTLRDKILLSLLCVGAMVETTLAEASTPQTIEYALSSLERKEFIRKKRGSIKSTISYLLAEKLLRASGSYRKRSFQLTEEGLNTLFSKFPTLKYRKFNWDGRWRVVIYDIREQDHRLRDRLRTRLKSLGFKFMQKSVWISPYPMEADLEDFLRKENLWGRIFVFSATLPKKENLKIIRLFNL
ncbi:MAG: hypothetical protein AAB486_00735 [Patescibacteria group bacterium]